MNFEILVCELPVLFYYLMPLYQDGPLSESDRSEHERLYAVIYDLQAGSRNENRGIEKHKKYKLTDQQITLLDRSLR